MRRRLISIAVPCLLALGCQSATTPAPQPAQPVAAAAAQPAPIAAPPAPPATPKKLVCTGKSHETQGAGGADIEESALYKLMTSKLGGWSSCTSKILNKTDEEQLVTFGDGSTLTVDSYPSSDAAAQEAVVKTASAITRDEVIKALKHDQPPDGCGIDWSQLSKGGPNATGDFKASGTTCTTDLHIKMVNGSVVGFGYDVAA